MAIWIGKLSNKHFFAPSCPSYGQRCFMVPAWRLTSFQKIAINFLQKKSPEVGVSKSCIQHFARHYLNAGSPASPTTSLVAPKGTG